MPNEIPEMASLCMVMGLADYSEILNEKDCGVVICHPVVVQYLVLPKFRSATPKMQAKLVYMHKTTITP